MMLGSEAVGHWELGSRSVMNTKATAETWLAVGEQNCALQRPGVLENDIVRAQEAERHRQAEKS